MRYRIEYADGRCCNFANSRKDLLDWLKLLKDEQIVDIRKIYKSGVTDSVLDSYRSYLNGKGRCKSMKLTEEIEEFINLTITEHMGKEYAEWKIKQQSVAEPDKVEEEYEKVIASLSPEQEEAITKYCDAIFSSGADTEEFFYRLGLKDGLKLRKVIKSILKSFS